MSEKQWELLQGNGLTIGHDLSKEQREKLMPVIDGWLEYQKNIGKSVRLEDCLLKMEHMLQKEEDVNYYVVELRMKKKEENLHMSIPATFSAEAKQPAPLVFEPKPK